MKTLFKSLTKKLFIMKKTLLFLIVLTFSVSNYNGIFAQNWDETIKLAASDRAASDLFGYSVSISGDYAIVGAYQEDEDAGGGNTLSQAGSAYIFYNNSGTWEQMQKIVASDRAAGDWFGYSVSISGDYAIVAAYYEEEDAGGGNTLFGAGSAYIFYNNSGTWEQKQKIVASDRAASDRFGQSVSISGDYAIVGAYEEDEDAGGGNTLSMAGSAYIFYNNSGTWEQKQKIVASDRAAGDYFGYSVSISGDYAIVGAYQEDQDAGGGNTLSSAGSAYIFYNNSGTWEQMQKIVASDRAAVDQFGYSVSISGDYAIVGAHQEDEDAGGGNTLSMAGSAYIFYNNSGTWEQANKIVASDRAASDHFGQSVSISGDYAIVGANYEDEDAGGGNTLNSAGSAYIFYNNSGTWEQKQKIVASDRATYDYFGRSVSISGYYAIVGAHQEDEDAGGGNTLSAAGSAYIFSNPPNTYYVDHSASGSNNGSSWTNAYTSLQSALDAAVSGDEIWVAKGTYYPSQETDGTTDTPRKFSFQMKQGVAIYGGFAGTESATSERTDYSYGETNETTLSGDFDDDDVITGSGSTLSISGNSENCYHIFDHPSGYTLSSSAVLDGFTITGGNANGSANPWNDGGAIYNNGSSSPTINNCFFTGNYVSDNGAAIANVNADNVVISNCTFALNRAEDAGGGISNYNSDATIINCLFYGNRADDEKGGGIYNYSASNPTITNCTFTENHSVSGGGVYNNSNSDATFTNCILWGNIITSVGPQIRNYDGSNITISYCDIEGGIAQDNSGGVYSTNNGSSHTDGGGNIDSDPEFVGSGVNSSHPYSIFGISPCADVGDNSACTETYDIRGSDYGRKLDKDDGTSGTIDIGAYEYKYNVDQYSMVKYVDADASGSNDGTSWTDAYTSIQSALDAASSGDYIWVAEGTYKPSSAYDLTNTSRYYHFRMIEGVEIYGGFSGSEAHPSARTDYGVGGANETILSGDFNGDDVVTGSGSTLSFSNNSENSYHVFYHPSSTNLTASAVLDGFTITGGYPNENGHYSGGGIYNNNVSPSFNNCTFTGNSTESTSSGGGMYNTNSSPGITNCTFSYNSTRTGGGIYDQISTSNITSSNFIGNKASYHGGGIYTNNTGAISVTSCSFSDNYAGNAGGIFIKDANPTVTNCTFINNSVNYDGGGMYIHSCSPSLINCTFSQNTSSRYGGGIYLTSSSSTPGISNTILWNNTASNSGNEIYNSSSSNPTFYYCDIEGSGGSSSWAGSSFGTDGGNNIDSDPLFVGSGDYPYCVTGISPCADVGNDAANSETYDIRGSGYARKLNKADGTAGTIDIGAYEYKYGTDPLAAEFTWDGSTDTDWNTAANWSVDVVPTLTDNVVIPDVDNDPVISSTGTASANNFTIENGATLSIQSDASGVGSLITNGTLTNNGTVNIQRYVSESVWHFISSPNNVTTANTFDGDYLQTWDETTATWSDVTETSTVLTPVKGYGFWGTPSKAATYTFSGTPNTGNQSLAVTYTEVVGYGNDGGNLLGNPYPSSIDWGGLDDTWGAVYYWTGTQYASWNDGSATNGGVQYIPPMQGFFIVVTTSGTFSLTNSNRTNDGASAYFKASAELPANSILLETKSGGLTDELFIRIDNEATEDFELTRDAYKFPSNTEGLSQLYSFTGEKTLSIDVRPETEVIQLGFQNDENGNYSLCIKDIADLSGVKLEDTKTGTYHDLQSGSYEFAWSITDNEKRFKLHLNALGIENDFVQQDQILIYSSGKTIYFKNLKNLNNVQIRISDITGKIVLEKSIQSSGLISISTNLKSGIYIVSVINKNEIQTEKIIIN
jgi:parallel beta-helix repeat protein